jgi:hypothetical protein
MNETPSWGIRGKANTFRDEAEQYSGNDSEHDSGMMSNKDSDAKPNTFGVVGTGVRHGSWIYNSSASHHSAARFASGYSVYDTIFDYPHNARVDPLPTEEVIDCGSHE